MNKKVEKEDLGFLGEEAQRKIVKGLIEDKRFFLTVESQLNPNAFVGDNGVILRTIVGIIKDFYDEHKRNITYSELDMLLKSKASTDIELEEYSSMLKEIRNDKYLIGLETAKDLAIKFFKQQETVKVLSKSIESIFKNGYNTSTTISDIQDKLSKIAKTSDGNIGYNVFELFDRVMDRTEEEKVNTGIKELDEAMNGGISKGMVGLLIAGTGAGKSTLASILCNGASRNGHKVVQIFFEENIEDIASKHYAHLTALYTNKLNSKSDKIAVWQDLSKNENIKNAMTNNIKLIRMSNGDTQVEDIRNMLNKLSAEGFKADMVFIDYFSCLQKSSNKMVEYENEWKAGEKAMKKIEQMAQDLNIAVWVAEQTNRNGVKLDKSNDRIANIQGSFRVTQPCSFIFYLDRTGCTDNNKANLYMDKSRGCRPTQWENIYLNNGNCQIDMSDIIPTDIDKVIGYVGTINDVKYERN